VDNEVCNVAAMPTVSCPCCSVATLADVWLVTAACVLHVLVLATMSVRGPNFPTRSRVVRESHNPTCNRRFTSCIDTPPLHSIPRRLQPPVAPCRKAHSIVHLPISSSAPSPKIQERVVHGVQISCCIMRYTTRWHTSCNLLLNV
jgi:hypothetical protein